MQRLHRIRTRGAEGLQGKRDEGHRRGHTSRQQEYQRVDLRPVGKSGQPYVHGVIRQQGSHDSSDYHQEENPFGQQQNDLGRGGAQYLADPDLLGALLGGEGRQAEQSQAGDEDTDPCEYSGSSSPYALANAC